MDNFEDRLINNVRAHECLYNKKSKRYKDNKYKDQIWKNICEECNRSEKDCKQRWKSLRDQYNRELRRQKQPSGSGTTDEGPYFKYFYDMNFLKDFVQPRPTEGNFDLRNPELEIEVLESAGTDCELFKEMFSDASMLSPEPAEATRLSDTSSSSRSRKRRAEEKIDELLGDVGKTLEKINKDSEEEDEYTKFFLSLADKCRKENLDSSQFIEIQMAILSIFGQKMSELKR